MTADIGISVTALLSLTAIGLEKGRQDVYNAASHPEDTVGDWRRDVPESEDSIVAGDKVIDCEAGITSYGYGF